MVELRSTLPVGALVLGIAWKFLAEKFTGNAVIIGGDIKQISPGQPMGFRPIAPSAW